VAAFTIISVNVTVTVGISRGILKEYAIIRQNQGTIKKMRFAMVMRFF
jgi:hypothetical protein